MLYIQISNTKLSLHIDILVAWTLVGHNQLSKVDSVFTLFRYIIKQAFDAKSPHHFVLLNSTGFGCGACVCLCPASWSQTVSIQFVLVSALFHLFAKCFISATSIINNNNRNIQSITRDWVNITTKHAILTAPVNIIKKHRYNKYL